MNAYGDNLVAKCDMCGKAIHLCTCDNEDEYESGIEDTEDDADSEDQMFEIERGYAKQR